MITTRRATINRHWRMHDDRALTLAAALAVINGASFSSPLEALPDRVPRV